MPTEIWRIFVQDIVLKTKSLNRHALTDKSKTLIDVALASYQERYSIYMYMGSLHLGVSDHDLVYVIRKNKLARPKPRLLIEYRSMTFFDHSKFLLDLNKVPYMMTQMIHETAGALFVKTFLINMRQLRENGYVATSYHG